MGSSFIVPQVNHLALNTDYALRTGAFDPSKGSTAHELTTYSSILKDKALERYTEAKVWDYKNINWELKQLRRMRAVSYFYFKSYL